MDSEPQVLGVEVKDDRAAMQLALALAAHAAEMGEVPVGAVVVRNGVVIAARFNERETLQDPTAHAEVLALRDAALTLGEWRLNDCTPVINMCGRIPMCSG